MIYLYDKYDFDPEISETLTVTFFNTAAWLFTQTGIMNEISVEISFIY